jgi:hypothetical protein
MDEVLAIDPVAAVTADLPAKVAVAVDTLGETTVVDGLLTPTEL